MTAGPDPDACRALAAYLTGTEAKALADRFAAGYGLTAALRAVPADRRQTVRRLVDAAAGGSGSGLVGVLRAVEGALDRRTSVDPVFTVPGNLALSGRVGASVAELVERARTSVVCSTYNFQRSSVLWDALAGVSERPEVDVRLYLDLAAAGGAAAAIAGHLRRARVFGTVPLDGKAVRNHAKFVAVDHRWICVTSANFSRSAERLNLELGVVVDNPMLTEAVERQWSTVEETLFRRLRPR